MTRIYKQPSVVSGKSVEDILSMDIKTFNSLNESDMRMVVGRLVSAGNKRIRQLEKHGIESPALKTLKESGGVLTVKGKNLNELRQEFARARNFFESKTSSVTGYKRVKKETVNALKKAGVNISPDKLDEVFRLFSKLKEVDSSVTNKQMKYRVLEEISSMVSSVDPDTIINRLTDKIATIYEEQQKLITGGDSGVSQFFDV